MDEQFNISQETVDKIKQKLQELSDKSEDVFGFHVPCPEFKGFYNVIPATMDPLEQFIFAMQGSIIYGITDAPEGDYSGYTTIRLSGAYTEVRPDMAVERIVPHEFAHAVAYNENLRKGIPESEAFDRHEGHWKSVLVRMGYDLDDMQGTLPDSDLAKEVAERVDAELQES